MHSMASNGWSRLVPQIHPKFHYKKEDSPSHQNTGTYIE
jgi:hypothetical protein